MIAAVGIVAHKFVEPDFTRGLESAGILTTLHILQVADQAPTFNRLIFLLGWEFSAAGSLNSRPYFVEAIAIAFWRSAGLTTPNLIVLSAVF
ncbi:hypothetical protein [Nostoc sp.]|uniref:hypothetical protein n=1 Tax=Nostoc sp. TaxID=1180 RepID=UPI002FF91EEE